MFWDELELIAIGLNTPWSRRWLRRAAFFQFADLSEPLEKIGHTDPPIVIRCEWEPVPEAYECPTCGMAFTDLGRFRRHIERHRRVGPRRLGQHAAKSKQFRRRYAA
jgi:uncharacterized C2H2 Zn-finger protein